MTDEVVEQAPIPVRIIQDDVPEKSEAATYGGWKTIYWGGNETAPIKVLPYDVRRKRAVIVVNASADQGAVIFGSLQQVGNGVAATAPANAYSTVSGLLVMFGPAAITFEVQSCTELWATNFKADGFSFSVGVLDEIYRT